MSKNIQEVKKDVIVMEEMPYPVKPKFMMITEEISSLPSLEDTDLPDSEKKRLSRNSRLFDPVVDVDGVFKNIIKIGSVMKVTAVPSPFRARFIKMEEEGTFLVKLEP